MHVFDPKIAVKVGVNAAIIYQNIIFWIGKNEANGKHFYDGSYWTYNSVSAFLKLFPYFSRSQIKTALTKLIDDGLLIKGDYNKVRYDRTNWYSIPSIGEKSPIDEPDIANSGAGNNQPIPDVNADVTDDVPPTPNGEVDLFGDNLPIIDLTERSTKAFADLWSYMSNKMPSSKLARSHKSKASDMLHKMSVKRGHSPEEVTEAIKYMMSLNDFSKNEFQFMPALERLIRDGKYEPFIGKQVDTRSRANKAEIAKWKVAAHRYDVSGTAGVNPNSIPENYRYLFSDKAFKQFGWSK